jgi:hypothetical protein
LVDLHGQVNWHDDGDAHLPDEEEPDAIQKGAAYPASGNDSEDRGDQFLGDRDKPDNKTNNQ